MLVGVFPKSLFKYSLFESPLYFMPKSRVKPIMLLGIFENLASKHNTFTLLIMFPHYSTSIIYGFDMDQCVPICHFLKLGQDWKKLLLCPLLTIWEASHWKDSRNCMSSVFVNVSKNVFEIRIRMVMWLQHKLKGGKLNIHEMFSDLTPRTGSS